MSKVKGDDLFVTDGYRINREMPTVEVMENPDPAERIKDLMKALIDGEIERDGAGYSMHGAYHHERGRCIVIERAGKMWGFTIGRETDDLKQALITMAMLLPMVDKLIDDKPELSAAPRLPDVLRHVASSLDKTIGFFDEASKKVVN